MLSEDISDKLLLIEKAMNSPEGFPTIDNWPMIPYSSLPGATWSLVDGGRKVAIVTGFYIPGAETPAAETDGPPGALVLAEGLREMGIEVLLISDAYTTPTLRAGLEVLDLSERDIPLISFPMEHRDENYPLRKSNEETDSAVSIAFVRDFLESPGGQGLTHFVFIERVGPSHTIESFLNQERQGAPPLKIFEVSLPGPMRNRCYNSRLQDVTRFTAKTHFLIEYGKRVNPRIRSIGIGDRGNEIGAGNVPWEVFQFSLQQGRKLVFSCRTATDYLISSGISNWGGYGLLAGVALGKGRLDILEKVSPDRERRVLNHIVQYGPAVDGITGRQHPSVDGMEFDEYMTVINRIRKIALAQGDRR